MTRRLIAPVLCLALLLAGCSSDPAPDASATPEPTATADPTATAGPTTTAEPESTSDSAQPDDDADADSDAGDSDEPASSAGFCPPATAGAEAQRVYLDATDRKSAETGREDDSGDPAVMNAAGQEMLDALDEIEAQWGEAQAALEYDGGDAATVTEEEADEAFDRYFSMVATYSRPEATAAATAPLIIVYDQATLQLLSDPAVPEAIADGNEALGQLLVYIQDRCGVLDAFAD